MTKSGSFAVLETSLLLTAIFLSGCGNQKESATTVSTQTTPPAASMTTTVVTQTSTTQQTSTSTQPATTTDTSWDTPPPTPAPSGAPTATTTSQTTPTAQTQTPTAPATSPAPAAGPLASGDGETSGTRVDIKSLQRSSDNIVKLKFVLVNDSAQEINLRAGYLSDPEKKSDEWTAVSGITLTDEAGKKKYFVVRDTEGAALCSQSIANLAAHSQAQFWAQFPAPPAAVQKISISIPHFEPITNVPLSQ